MVERDAELAIVDEALDQLTGPGPDAGGALLAFSGPAGLGKTTLLAELRRRAHARSCTVLAARGGEQEQSQPFHVARQLIQPQLAGTSEQELRAALGGWYSIVGPALGLCAPEQGPPPDPQGLRDGLDWVLTHLVVKRAPVTLVLDDAHWADPESLSWLAAFAPRAEHLPLLLVVAYRPDELPAHADAFRTLPGRAGQAPLPLAPLTPAAVAALVREALGDHADDAFCKEAWAVTTGNPFEAVELTAKVRGRGLRPVEENAPQLADLAAAQRGSGLVARLERLGPSTVRFAWACAVLGTAIPQDIAARAPPSAPRRPRAPPHACGTPASCRPPGPPPTTNPRPGWSSSTPSSPPPSTGPSPTLCASPCTGRPRRPSSTPASAPPRPPATCWRPTPRTTPGSCAPCARPPGRTSAPEPPTPPAASSPAPCASHPTSTNEPPYCTNWAAPLS
ncbi:ATP-binding protein [Streptomyces virginiae]|uniref:ATP-binding protein n=1 Tax=Streptomyces virginiae TaxID=1961 RepID=UPI000AC9F299